MILFVTCLQFTCFFFKVGLFSGFNTVTSRTQLTFGCCYAPENWGLSSGIYYAHKSFRGIFSLGKTMPSKFQSVIFANFLCPGNSVVKQQSTSWAFISISYVLLHCGGWICMSSYAWTVIVPSRGFFCCRVTFAWKKISVSEFTTDYTHHQLRYHESVARLETYRSLVSREQANAEKQIKCTEYRMHSYRMHLLTASFPVFQSEPRAVFWVLCANVILPECNKENQLVFF